ALGARARLAGARHELPETGRMCRSRSANVEVRIRNVPRKAKKLRLALALPQEIESRQEEASGELPPGSEWSRFSWAFLPRKRGSYQLQAANIETQSPVGFWDVRQAIPARSELRVYPNLFKERRDLAALFLHRGSFGLHAQRQVGKGREFEKLREYIPGDGFDEIHWKATAKRGRPVTKVFQIERTQEIYILIDASRLSARSATPNGPTTGAPMLERYITAALVLGLAAERQGDLFGLL